MALAALLSAGDAGGATDPDRNVRTVDDRARDAADEQSLEATQAASAKDDQPRLPGVGRGGDAVARRAGRR